MKKTNQKTNFNKINEELKTENKYLLFTQKYLMPVLWFLSIVALLLSLSACNTTAGIMTGIGKDLQVAGEFVEKKSNPKSDLSLEEMTQIDRAIALQREN